MDSILGQVSRRRCVGDPAALTERCQEPTYFLAFTMARNSFLELFASWNCRENGVEKPWATAAT